MSGEFFDSNVLLYLFDDVDFAKNRRASGLLEESVDRNLATISFQVVQEVLNVVTKRLTPPAGPDHAQFMLAEVLAPLWTVMPSRRLYEEALLIHERYQYAFYDSLIIAAAIEADCERLWTEDMQHGQVIDGLTIVNPFLDPG